MVDNGSTDKTATVSRLGGARVVYEPRRGYGRACLAGIKNIQDDTDVVVFLDGDYSFRAEEMNRLIEPIAEGRSELVVGSRITGMRQTGSMPRLAELANRFFALLVRTLYGVALTDIGPFRAISFPALKRLGMGDEGYGWTVEMIAKAAKAGLSIVEVPVSYHRRVGKSKITGSKLESLKAGCKIIHTILKYA